MRGIVPRVGEDDEAQEEAFRAQYNRHVTTGQRVNAERLALLGWGRAVLLQLAHPLVAAGVAEHSSFRGGPAANVKRLHSTVRAMLDLSFGTPEDVRRAVGHINAIHDRVNGTLREAAGRFCAGTPYTANDPDLLVWVDATVRDSMLLAYELFVGPLSAGDRDRYWVEGEDITTALRVPAERPHSIAESVQSLLCRDARQPYPRRQHRRARAGAGNRVAPCNPGAVARVTFAPRDDCRPAPGRPA